MDQGWVAVAGSQARGQVGVVRGQGVRLRVTTWILVSGPAPQTEASTSVQSSTAVVIPPATSSVVTSVP